MCNDILFSLIGAMLSGMREAGRIADLFTGCPYALPQNNVILIDDDDDEDIQISNERGRREKETMVAEESSGSGRGDDIGIITLIIGI